MKKLLTLAAVVEAATGVALIGVPSLVGRLLLGAALIGVGRANIREQRIAERISVFISNLRGLLSMREITKRTGPDSPTGRPNSPQTSIQLDSRETLILIASTHFARFRLYRRASVCMIG
jgi:hypothetical protein